MITWRTTGYLILILLTYVFLSIFQLDILVVVLITLLVLPVLSVIQMLIARGNLRIEQRLDPPLAERGDPVQLNVQLEASGMISHGQLSLSIQKPGHLGQPVYARKELALAPGSKTGMAFQLETNHRGVYPAGLAHVESRDLLGLLRLTMKSRRECRPRQMNMTILPKPQEIPGLAAIASQLAGLVNQRLPRTGDEVDDLANLRGLHPGESLKRVHWKVSARLDAMMVKEYENPVLQQGLVLLDMAHLPGSIASATENLDRLDFYTDRAAFLAKTFADCGISVKYVFYEAEGRQEIAVERQDDYTRLQILLSGLEWTDSWPAEAALREEAGPGSHYWFVLLLATRLTPAAADYLASLQNEGKFVCVVLLLERPDSLNALRTAVAQLENRDIPIILQYRKAL
jgi:uncharacterized protein (DUF58 family)